MRVDDFEKRIQVWVSQRYVHLALYNLILLALFLLRSAGYFHPFFEISVNFIVLAGVILAIILLGARSKAIFLSSITFWSFALFLRYLRIEVWAERTAIYSYECLLIGIVMLVLENSVNFFRKK